MIELADDDAARHPDRLALVPEGPGGAVDTVVGRHDEERAVGRAQSCAELADEVGVAGGVEQVDLHVADRDRREGEADGALLADLGLVVVGDGRAVFDSAGAGELAGRGQQRLDEGCLAGAGRPDEDDVANGSRRRRLAPGRLRYACCRWLA